MRRQVCWSIILFLLFAVGLAVSQTDSIPPEVNWTKPPMNDTLSFHDGSWWCGGAMPDSMFQVYFYDPSPSGGIDTSSLIIKIRDCSDTTWTTIDGYETYFSFEYGNAWGALNILGLDFDMCYELCAFISDNYGNEGEGCVTFYTSPPDTSPPADDCPPGVVAWEPADTSCISSTSGFHIIVCDNTIECSLATGVDPTSIDVTLQVGSLPPENITAQCSLEYGGLHCLDIFWDHPGAEFPPNETISLCVNASDSAGNDMPQWCNNWFTCPLSDTCPPEVIWSYPRPGDTLNFDGTYWWAHNAYGYSDTFWNVEFMEIGGGCPMTGIDSTSLHIFFGICGDSLFEITPDNSYFGWDYASAQGLLNSLELEYGKCYTLCAHISDMSDNEGVGCVEFYTPPPPDICDPHISEFHPGDGDTLCPPDGDIWFVVVDPMTDSCSCSDMEYVMAVITTGDTSFYLSIEYGLVLDTLGECMSRFILNDSYYELVPGSWASLFVQAYDMAGNDASDTISFYVCEPSDTCPPYVTYWEPFPGDTACSDTLQPIHAQYFVDPSGPGCVWSGVDTTSFQMTVIIDGDSFDVTSELTIGSYGDDVWWYHDALPFPPGAHIVACLDFADNAGNWAHECIEFDVCGEPPTDLCAPYISGWRPIPDDTLCPSTDEIWFTIVDPLDSLECPICTGVIDTTLIVNLHNHGDVYEMFDGGGLFIDHYDSCAVLVYLDEAYYSLVPGTGATLCVSGADGAGNYFSDCIEFFVCDTMAEPDTCPPYVDHWFPSGDSCISTTATIGALVCEDLECPHTSINLDSITVTLSVGSEEPTDITSMCYFDFAEQCVYISYSIGAAGAYPEGTTVSMCIRVADNAGNVLEDCFVWNTCTEATDDCAPLAGLEYPIGFGCLPPDSGHIIVDIWDPHDSVCAVATGIDDTTIDVTISYGDGTPVNITEECSIFVAFGGYRIKWDYSGLPEGETVLFCVSAADLAGNWMDPPACFDWVTCTEVTDTCPPVVDWLVPEDGETLVFDGGVWWHIASTYSDTTWSVSFTDSECPGTGLDTATLEIAIRNCEDTVWIPITEYWTYWYDVHGNARGLLSALGLVPGECYEICAEISDLAGNRDGNCITFYTADTLLPEDECPPYVMMWHPPDTSTLCPPDADIWFRLIDPHGTDTDCPTCSGIDRAALEVHLYNHGEVFGMFDGGGLIFEDIGDCAMDVLLDNAYYWLTPGTGATLCVSGADEAGNSFDDCIVFWVCDTGFVDDCTPEIVEWSPPDGECLSLTGPWGVHIRDPYDPIECPGVTGIDRGSFTALMIVDDDTFDVTDDCWIDSWGFHGVEVEWLPEGWILPPDLDITVCIMISDFVSNTAAECHEFTTCSYESVDFCPPFVAEWHPEGFDTICPPDFGIWFRLLDPADTPDCPMCSGIDVFSLVVHLSSGGELFELVYDEGLFVEPFGECGVDVALDHEYFSLAYGSGATLCVAGTDIVGNEFYDCVVFFVCEDDTCPPEVSWMSPLDGDTLWFDSGWWWVDMGTHIDSSFYVNFSEFGCPPTGLMDGSVHIWLSECDTSSYYEIDGYSSYLSWDYGSASGSFSLLELAPNGCYTLCAQVTDNAGNEGYDCVTFYTGGFPDTVDYCPPVVVSWFPDVDSCLGISSPLGLVLADPLSGDCPIASGVDLLSVMVTVEIGADTAIDITSECDFASEGDYLGIQWNHIGWALPEGENIVLCVYASDFAGNYMSDCFSWYTCGGEPEDFCPPVAELELPDTAWCIPPDSGVIMIDIFDQYSDLCPHPTGVDDTTISVMLFIDDSTFDITGDCDIYPLSDGYRTSWTYGGLDDGVEIMICVHAADLSGNWMYPPGCFSWRTCSEEPVDECPPVVDWISIYDGSMGVPIDSYIGFDLLDPYDTPDCSLCTGIDASSVVLTIISLGDTVDIVFTLDDPLVNWYAAECMMSVWLDSSFYFEYGTEYAMCIDAADNEGNVMETYCVHFTTEEESLVDIWPPCVMTISPEPGAEVMPPFDVWAQLCDLCEGAEFATGVDSASIQMTINGDDVTDELEFEPLDCYGWAVSWHSGWLAEGEYEICLWGHDFAMNWLDTCWSVNAIIPDTLVVVDIIEPLNDTWTSCSDQQIIAYFPDGVPDSFSFSVSSVNYTLSSPEVAVSGDTLFFTPSVPWADGEVCYHIGTAVGCFGVDATAPEIELLYPSCYDSVDWMLWNITVGFTDDGSGIDLSNTVVTINAVAFTVDSPGVHWDATSGAMVINIVDAGLALDGEIEVCGMSMDSPDYCAPNSAVDCCNFYYTPPPMYAIAGFVTDTISGTPLEGMVIAAFQLLGMPFMVHTTTDASGFYVLDSLPAGMWIAGAFDPSFTYPPMFWEQEMYPFDADPIFLPPAVGDTFWADFEMGLTYSTLYRITGTVGDSVSTAIQGAVIVAIATDDEDEELGISSDVTDEHGDFSIPVAPGKSYYLMAFSQGYRQSFYGSSDWRWSPGDSIAVAGDISGVDFELVAQPSDSGANSVLGTVFEETAAFDVEEMRGVLVCLCDIATDEPQYCDFSDYEGNYSIESVPDGTYRLIADRPLYVHQGVWETVELPTDTIAHDIYLRRFTAGIAEDNWKQPVSVVLHGARPNPFNTSTAIQFFVPEAGYAKLEIVDITGRTVATLLDENVKPGDYVSVWSAKDVSSGIYFVKLSFGGSVATEKLLLTK